ncbi:MAG: hypothetical protein H6838_02880 [Planctomycetes bacterium]|nr:hypothetical protein [Planctomycetota bacterium]
MNMHKLTLLTTLAAFAAPIAAQQSMMPYLPKGTMVALSAPDLKTSAAEFQQMPLAKIWREEEVQNFFADLKEMVGKQIEMGMAQAKQMHAQGALPVDPEKLMNLDVGGVEFAVTKLAFDMGDFGPKADIGLVFHMDYGAAGEQWKALLEIGLGLLEQQAGNMVTKSESMVGDVKVVSLLPNNAGGSAMGLNIAMMPNGLLVGTLTDDIKSVVANMQANKQDLGASTAYAAAAKEVQTNGAEAVTFFQFAPLVDFSMSLLKTGAAASPELAMVDIEGVERAIKAMGLRDLGTMMQADTYQGGKCISKSYHANGKAEATAAVAKPIDMSFLKWVPKQAVGVQAGKLNMMSIYDTLMVGLNAYDPEFAKMALQQLDGLEQQVGFKVRDDLFGAFGDHYISWSMPMSSIGAAPEIGMLIKVNDGERLVKVLKSMTAMSNGMVDLEEADKRGIKTYQLRVNFDPTNGMGGFNIFEMFTPTFAFKDGYLVGAFSASDVKRVFGRMDREDDPKGDIRGNKEFAAAMAGVPASVTGFSFTDWKAQFESVYQMATGLLALVPIGDDVPIDLAMLPDSATLTKHLFGGVSYTTSDASGTLTTYTGPVGPEMYLAIIALAGGAGAAGAMIATRGF